MDLHPILGVSNSTIEFSIVQRGRFVRVDVPIETVAECVGVRETLDHCPEAKDIVSQPMPLLTLAIIRSASAPDQSEFA